ncbi:MAG: hypothetical protein E7016_01210 [Alphaproteobacteria bacterium]|nr:hypothetical protein [Alphaproteobacteria bacterium]
MTQNIKIAVQFFGHLRTFEKCAISIKKHILSKYDCDVFMHTWSDTEHSTQTWHNMKSKVQTVNQKMLEKIEKQYLPKMTLVEKQILPEDDTLMACMHNKKAKMISANGMKFMLKSQIKVNELRKQYAKKNGINYDIVLMLRPDIYLYSDLDINKIVKECNAVIDYPARFCVSNALKKGGTCAFTSDMLSDVFYLATPSSMDLIVDAFKNIKFEKFTEKLWTPENLITNILFKKGIATFALLYFFNRDFEIIRGSYCDKEKRKRFISFKLSHKTLRLNIFGFMAKSFVSMDFHIFNLFNIDFSIGKPHAKC